MGRTYTLTTSDDFVCDVVCTRKLRKNTKNIPLEFWFVHPLYWDVARLYAKPLPTLLHSEALFDAINRFFNQLPKPMHDDCYHNVYDILADANNFNLYNVCIVSKINSNGQLLSAPFAQLL
jgi:hypothetical protein